MLQEPPYTPLVYRRVVVILHSLVVRVNIGDFHAHILPRKLYSSTQTVTSTVPVPRTVIFSGFLKANLCLGKGLETLCLTARYNTQRIRRPGTPADIRHSDAFPRQAYPTATTDAESCQIATRARVGYSRPCIPVFTLLYEGCLAYLMQYILRCKRNCQYSLI